MASAVERDPVEGRKIAADIAAADVDGGRPFGPGRHSRQGLDILNRICLACSGYHRPQFRKGHDTCSGITARHAIGDDLRSAESVSHGGFDARRPQGVEYQFDRLAYGRHAAPCPAEDDRPSLDLVFHPAAFEEVLHAPCK